MKYFDRYRVNPKTFALENYDPRDKSERIGSKEKKRSRTQCARC